MNEPIRLQTQIDTAQAKASHRGLKDQVVADNSQMQAASRKTDASILELSATTRRVAGLATSGFSAIAAGIGAAKASADNLETSLVSVGSSLTAAFLAGGPIGLGIGLLGVGIGVLAGRTNDASDAASRARIAHERWLATVRERAEQARRATAELRGEMDGLIEQLRGFSVNRTPAVFDAILGERAELVESLRLLRERQEAALRTARTPLEEAGGALSEGIAGFLSGGGTGNLRVGDGLARVNQLTTSMEALRGQIDATDKRLAEIAKPWLEQLVGAEAELQRLARGSDEVSRLKDLIASFDNFGRVAAVVHFDDESLRRLEAAKHGLEELLALEESRRVIQRGAGSPGQEGGGFYSQEAFDSLQRTEAIRARLLEQDSQEFSLLQQIAGIQREINILTRKGEHTTRMEAVEAKALSVRKQLLEDELAALREVNAELHRRRQLLGDQELRRQIELLSAANPYERELRRISHDRDRLLEAGRDPAAVSEFIQRQIAALDPMTALDPFLQGLTNTLGRGLSDIIVDGITTGFDNAANIARQVMDQLLRSLISQIVNSGIQQLMGSLLSGGLGGGTSTLSSVASVVTSIAGGGITGSVAPAAVPIPAPGGC